VNQASCCKECGQKLPVTLGQRIRSSRMVRGLSGLELAERVEISGQYLSRIELDQKSPSLRVVRGLAAKLGVSMDWLLGGQNGQA
jgi:transcriptional regulator with XRE-family HTH domain